MSIIIFDRMSYYYPDPYRVIFEDVDLALDTGWRTGIVGRNGAGKTTLLKIIKGGITPTEGHMSVQKKFEVSVYSQYEYAPGTKAMDAITDMCVPFGILRRKIAELGNRTDASSLKELGELMSRYELLGGYELESDILREASLLGFSEADMDRDITELSPGERTRCGIIALFLRKGVFPLLDEPTNHLDVSGRIMLGRYLSQKRGFMVVSHDRDFLDSCCDHTLYIGMNTIEVIAGNFSVWAEHNRKRLEEDEKKNIKLKAEISNMKRAMTNKARWSMAVEKGKAGAYDKGHVGALAAKLMKTSKVYEARVNRAIEEKESLFQEKVKKRTLKLNTENARVGTTVAAVSELAAGYGGRNVFENVNFSLNKGERLAVEGGNGSGKTTLLRTLRGELAYTGRIYLPGHVKVSWANQVPRWAEGSLRKKLLESGIDETVFRNVLGIMGVEGEIFEQPLETFSMGELKKVELCRSLTEEAHLLIWDEPMNYVDAVTREQIEDVILKFQPTMIFVEHDRRFVRKIATQSVDMDDLKTKEV